MRLHVPQQQRLFRSECLSETRLGEPFTIERECKAYTRDYDAGGFPIERGRAKTYDALSAYDNEVCLTTFRLTVELEY